MSRMTLNLLLIAAVIVIAGLNWILKPDYSKPNALFLPEMVHSIPYDAFASNPVFADGKTLQEPDPGAIARGRQPLHYEATPEDAVRAGAELINPFAADTLDALARGEFIYTTFCFPCHGLNGVGDGPVALRGFPPPANFAGEKAMQMKDGQMFHVITYGQGNMPSYASQIPPQERWKAVAYVRSLQQKLLAAASEAQP
jgi:mono/diheme cytochrome c family protein